jgi:hypothetical protein
MLPSERPKVSRAKRGPILTGEQVEQTIAAAHEPFRTLFTVAALTSARISELCGLTWADLRVEDSDEAEIEFGWQMDGHGNRRPTKTDGSARTVPIPPELAVVLTRHRSAVGKPSRKASCSLREQVGHCSSATSRAPCARRRGEQSTATDGPAMRSSTNRTTRDSRFPSHVASFRRCTRFDTPSSLAAPSWRSAEARLRPAFSPAASPEPRARRPRTPPPSVTDASRVGERPQPYARSRSGSPCRPDARAGTRLTNALTGQKRTDLGRLRHARLDLITHTSSEAGSPARLPQSATI